MRTLEEYLKLPYRLVLTPDQDEGGYVASYPDLPGCITCAPTVEAAVAASVDAKERWLAAAMEDGVTIKEPEMDHKRELEMHEEYDIKNLNPRSNPYAKLSQKQVTINLDETVVAYFKDQSENVGIPYQTLINLYLRDCVSNQRHLDLSWK